MENKLYGLLLYPSCSNHDEYEKTIHSSEYAVKEGFRSAYQNHIAAMEIVAMSAKIYSVNNWNKVNDWSDLNIHITDNTGKETHYYKYKERNIKCYSKFAEERRKKMNDEDKKNENPVLEVSGVVLDPSDGDFSLTINGNHHLWIDDESVIVLADYIEKNIKQK